MAGYRVPFTLLPFWRSLFLESKNCNYRNSITSEYITLTCHVHLRVHFLLNMTYQSQVHRDGIKVVFIQLSSWRWAQSCSKHVEDSNKHIIEEIMRQVGHFPELTFNCEVVSTHYNYICIPVLITRKMATWVAETCRWFTHSMVHSPFWRTPRSTVLLEKLVKKFPAFHGIIRFITASQSLPPVPILSQINPVSLITVQ
jgi:hypothetical protein